MEKDAPIFVAGHRGLAGSAIVRLLQKQNYTNILVASRAVLDLENKDAVYTFFQEKRPRYIFLAAAKVGGIHANNIFPADFIFHNLTLQNNVIEAAHRFDCRRLIFLGSSCIYPKYASQPISEDQLMRGALEPTNEAYAIAKIAGIKMCEAFNRQHNTDFRSLMPTNLYGPNDNFSLDTSHVFAALMHKIHVAKEKKADSVSVWGSGKPYREFLHADDLAAAAHFVMSLPERVFKKAVTDYQSHINVGTGKDISIRELVKILKEIIGYSGAITWDASKPDGVPKKLLDISKIKTLGWNPQISLSDGISATYDWFREHYLHG